MEIIKPPKLKRGDVIGIVSPSGAVDPKLKDQFNKGVKFLEDIGFMVKVSKNAFKRYFYSAGTAQDRADDIHEMFQDKEVKAIIQSQGGETENEILDLLDWDLIKNNPKPFCGMSDGTVLLLSIFAKTGMVTLHGPDVLWGYGRGCSDYEKESLVRLLLTGDVGVIKPDPNHKVSERSLNSSKSWKAWRGGVVSGKLIGGNLGVISRLHGTSYEPDYNGAILFVEAVHKDVEHMAMDFAYLRQAGIFDKIKGMVLGYCDSNMLEDKSSNRPVGEVLLEASAKYTFPIIEIGEIGHNTSNVNLPIGVNATIDAGKLRFSVDEVALV